MARVTVGILEYAKCLPGCDAMCIRNTPTIRSTLQCPSGFQQISLSYALRYCWARHGVLFCREDGGSTFIRKIGTTSDSMERHSRTVLFVVTALGAQNLTAARHVGCDQTSGLWTRDYNGQQLQWRHTWRNYKSIFFFSQHLGSNLRRKADSINMFVNLGPISDTRVWKSSSFGDDIHRSPATIFTNCDLKEKTDMNP